MKKYVNGILTDMTAEEITARQAEENQAVIDEQARLDAETTKANKKASGKQKLKDLGLNDDEIQALMGVE
jgi:hypothetical protein|tara:strand:- start:48 stop:257 length:210 start_codon:yes stop_codon:yes gene_type:complete